LLPPLHSNIKKSNLLLFLSSSTTAQFLSPPTALTAVGATGIPVRYKSVPAGTCELNPNVESYSSYADTSNTKQSIFFWMFEARNIDPATAPLTIRLDGGLGASSMNGLFQEIGPCTVDGRGKVVDNGDSWSRISILLLLVCRFSSCSSQQNGHHSKGANVIYSIYSDRC
jgi:carboxypeptidase C (cathepsin A)